MHLLRKVVNSELFDTYIRERLTINRPDHQEGTKQIRSPKGVWIKPRTFTKRTSAASCGTTATHYNLVCQAPDIAQIPFLTLTTQKFLQKFIKNYKQCLIFRQKRAWFVCIIYLYIISTYFNLLLCLY
ncbi:hypothetical protein AZE31_02915 [Paenibacillus polymyxa]|nr:hypothetical protein AZE31_02915 [Paenibacillus polymyxa]